MTVAGLQCMQIGKRSLVDHNFSYPVYTMTVHDLMSLKSNNSNRVLFAWFKFTWGRGKDS